MGRAPRPHLRLCTPGRPADGLRGAPPTCCLPGGPAWRASLSRGSGHLWACCWPPAGSRGEAQGPPRTGCSVGSVRTGRGVSPPLPGAGRPGTGRGGTRAEGAPGRRPRTGRSLAPLADSPQDSRTRVARLRREVPREDGSGPRAHRAPPASLPAAQVGRPAGGLGGLPPQQPRPAAPALSARDQDTRTHPVGAAEVEPQAHPGPAEPGDPRVWAGPVCPCGGCPTRPCPLGPRCEVKAPLAAAASQPSSLRSFHRDRDVRLVPAPRTQTPTRRDPCLSRGDAPAQLTRLWGGWTPRGGWSRWGGQGARLGDGLIIVPWTGSWAAA